MKNPRRNLVIAAGLFFVIGATWLGFFLGRPNGSNGTGPTARAGAGNETITATPTPLPSMPDRSPASLLTRMFARLRSGGLAAGEMEAFRRAMLSAPPGEAIAAIVQFLATGQDATTGEAFTIGEGGLSGAPTFRVLLLDLLGRLCRETGTSEAATVARTMLEKKTSADEWAVALRNVGWAAPNDTKYLAQKARELIGHGPWREQPSAGYRESFDVIVFSRDVSFIPDLSEMLKEDDDSLQTSAAVALDRLAETAPLQAMNFLNENREQLSDKPFLRADYFSKADLSQPAQRQAVEMYLSRPDVDTREKAKMLAVMASPGSFASETLLTQPPPDEFPPQRIAGMRQTIDDWITTNRFPPLTPPLRQLQARIAP